MLLQYGFNVILAHPEALQFNSNVTPMEDLSVREVGVTIVSFEEQTRGWPTYLAQARSLPQQVEAYARPRRMVENCRWIPLADFDTAASIVFQRLKAARVRIGTMDLKIAAIALARVATLVTRNRSDFEKVPGLIVEDWTT
jgi:tRNA(fMet)-specific endonuclease VapC